MTSTEKTVTVTVTAVMTESQAEALAQFCKRVGFSDFRTNAVDESEAYLMRAGLNAVRTGLAEQGYAPR